MLGHGRALELFLATLKIGLGAWIVLAPHGVPDVPPIADLAWHYPSSYLAMPFFLVGSLQLLGWSLNWRGFEFSWALRAAAATLAIFMWVWLCVKTEFVGESSPLVVVAFVSIPFSTLLLYKAWNRLPIPGAPGLR